MDFFLLPVCPVFPVENSLVLVVDLRDLGELRVNLLILASARTLRQSKHALGNDIALDLCGAACNGL